jgi:hypothetical protein
VNFDAFMRFHSSPRQERLAENSSFRRSSSQGEEHFDAVEYATLEWIDWFNSRRLLEHI